MQYEPTDLKWTAEMYYCISLWFVYSISPWSYFYIVFGWDELGEREVEAREIGEKRAISHVWQREEISEREWLKGVGPTFFRSSSLLYEEIAERVFQTCYLRFCPWFNIWNINEIMKQQVRWWCKNCKTAIAGYNEMVYINYYQLIQPTFFSRFINPTDMWVLLFINLFKQKLKLDGIKLMKLWA
jgi:hypothetical protein